MKFEEREIFESLISALNQFPTEMSFIIEFFTLFLLLAIFSYFFQKAGIFSFMILTMVAANIQVLKIVNYSFYTEPVALGKVMICFTFLAADVLAECYGKKNAYTGILLGFLSNISFITLMVITLGYSPLKIGEGINFHEHLKIVFTPVAGIFFAGVISFLLSQFLEVTIFLKLKEKFKGKFLGVRYFFATVISSFIDNIIFYTFAFSIFNNFVTVDTLIYTYIIGTFIFRFFIICASSWMIYFIKGLINLSMKRQIHSADKICLSPIRV